MKKVLITGGNKGIGLACTRIFLERGFEVIVTARDGSFQKDVQGVTFIELDLSKPERIPEFAAKVGPIDVLVNNAGVMNSLPYDNYPQEKMRYLMAINLESPVALIREFAKSMIEKGSGRIVNVGSVAGHTGQPDVWYAISKAGIMNATKSLAKLLGPKGIVVNAVAPGPVNTEMLEKVPRERKKQILNATMLHRPAEPWEVAKSIYWLATESPEYINGITIDINNGAYLR